MSPSPTMKVDGTTTREEFPMLKTFDGIALTLLIIGGINWLLVGAFEFDLVAAITAWQHVDHCPRHLYSSWDQCIV